MIEYRRLFFPFSNKKHIHPISLFSKMLEKVYSLNNYTFSNQMRCLYSYFCVMEIRIHLGKNMRKNKHR